MARIILGMALLAMVQGCLIVPVPHTRLHAYGIKGQIVDEEGVPVPNAVIEGVSVPNKISINYKRKQRTTIRKAVTDSDGYFTIKPIRGWHGAWFFAIPNGGGSLFPSFPYLYFHDDLDIYVNAFGFSEKKVKISCFVEDENGSGNGFYRIPQRDYPVDEKIIVYKESELVNQLRNKQK